MVEAYADSIQVRVRSTRWHYIAFMNGAWLEDPIILEMDRRGVASPWTNSLVRFLFVVVLLLPLAVLVRHRTEA